jgi:hypothetical protein
MVKKEALKQVNQVKQNIVEENMEDDVSPDELFDDLESTAN